MSEPCTKSAMAESWSLPNISFMAPQEAPRSALLQGAEADQGPGSTARRALTRPPSRGRERQLERRGAMLNATCRLVVRQRSVAMDPWILDPQTAGETQNFLESTPLSFLRAGPPKFRRISAESRAHPNFDKNFAKLRHRPTCNATSLIQQRQFFSRGGRSAPCAPVATLEQTL